MSRKSTLLSAAAEWLLSSATVLAALYSLSTAYMLTVQSPLIIVTALLCLCFTVLFRLKKRGLMLGLSALLILLTGALFYKPLFDSLRLLGQVLLNQLYLGYSWMESWYAPAELPPLPEVTAAFMLLAAVMSWLVCWGVTGIRKVWPSLLAVLPVVCACFLLLDSTPKPVYLLAVLACLCVQLLTQNVRHREPETSGKMLLLMTLPVLLTVGILYITNPPERYERGYTVEELGERLEELVQWQKHSGFSGSAGTADIRTDDLGAQQTGSAEVLEVTTQKSDGLLYLRGTAYADFDGVSWSIDESLWNADRGNVFTLASYIDGTADGMLYGLGVSEGQEDTQNTGESITVSTVAKEPLLYTPYFLMGYPDTAVQRGDAYLANEGDLREYTLAVTDRPLSSLLHEELATFYIHKTGSSYTALPEQTKQTLLGLAQEAGITALPPEQQPQAVEEYVRSRAGYSLNPAAAPKDRDFCSWFLTEAESGYCVHYAIAATAMLRALDIPARLVTGYVVTAEAGEPATVTQAQAHAWTEYYLSLRTENMQGITQLNGVGNWAPIDATPGEAVEFQAGGEQTSEQPSEQPTQPSEQLTEPETQEITHTLATEEPSGEEPPTADPPANPEQTPPERESRPLPWWLWTLIGLTAAALLLYLRRGVVWQYRKKKLAAMPPNQRALKLWRLLERLCKYLKKPLPDEAVQLARKARFSQYSLNEEELQQLAKAVRLAQKEAAKLPLPKRLTLRYILVYM